VLEERTTETSLTVSWRSGFAGGLDQTFVVEYRPLGGVTWMAQTISPGPGYGQVEGQIFTVEIRELHSATEYTIRVLAKNDAGGSTLTDTVTITTRSRK
jgi:hypothetical protein